MKTFLEFLQNRDADLYNEYSDSIFEELELEGVTDPGSGLRTGGFYRVEKDYRLNVVKNAWKRLVLASKKPKTTSRRAIENDIRIVEEYYGKLNAQSKAKFNNIKSDLEKRFGTAFRTLSRGYYGSNKPPVRPKARGAGVDTGAGAVPVKDIWLDGR